MRHLIFTFRVTGLVTLALLGGMWPMAAQAAGGGAAADFAVLASGTGLTCTNATVDGPVGVTTGTPVTLTPPNCAFPVQNADGAYADFLKTYGGIANNLFPCQIVSGTLAGQSLGTGVYCFPAAAALTGTLTLTGMGPWLFEIGTTGGALTATNFTVVGANPCNAFWWIRADVTTTDSTFQGTILGGGDITFTRTTLEGRAWATGAMTMTGPGNNIFGCNGASTVARHHCNQGVGNGPEGCDPGNSNQGDPSRSNDELGGTPGNPGRKGGHGKAGTETASISNVNSLISHTSDTVAAKSDSHVDSDGGVVPKSTTHAITSVSDAAKGKSNLHRNGKSKGTNK